MTNLVDIKQLNATTQKIRGKIDELLDVTPFTTVEVELIRSLSESLKNIMDSAQSARK